MVDGVPGWTPHVERSLKEVLYRFLEEVHCTKAALYLRTPAGHFQLAVRYGFGRGDAPPAGLEPDDPLVIAAGRAELPMIVNRAGEEPLLTARLRATGVQRLVLAPLVDGGRLIGLVEGREKGGQQSFDESDRQHAATIAGVLLTLVGELGLARSLELAPVAAGKSEEVAAAPPATATRAAADLLDEPAMAELVEAAAEALIRDRSYAVAVTVVEPAAATTLVLASVNAGDGDATAIKAHQAKVLLGCGATVPRRGGWNVEWRRLRAGEKSLRPSLIVSEVALQDAGWSLALSVVGAEGSEDPAQVMDRLQREVAAVHRLSSLRYARRCLARRLLEPGESRFPDLLVHSLAVSRLCWQMVRAAGGGLDRAEQAALAGLLHDVGMRELDYERLYRLERPGPEHRRVYRRHVVVGERIVRGVGFDEVAAAIRHHHERWDGTGYPDRLGGDRIPQLARLVHVAEVFDVLTSPSSYLAPVPPERALATLTSGAGAQFDPEMVELLARVAS
jgi:putative nucleotidyltransferase with HDIG domain